VATPSYAIHPAIGIARVGDSPDGFYLAPEQTGAPPIACDADGNEAPEQPVKRYRDADGRIMRQAARFQILVYDDANPQGRPLKKGDMIHGPDTSGELVDIHWHAYLANKKAAWYEFKELEGEHGYTKHHPLRNAAVTGDDARSALIIDPGPVSVNITDKRRASFARGENPKFTQTFPPPLAPASIDTLGDLMTDDQGRLILLGGHGASGSYLSGLGEPRISDYANNDGWFDDVSDGPVTAILEYRVAANQTRHVQVQVSAWALVGNPAYAPEIVNMITLDDLLYDVSVRELAYDPYLYSRRHFNPDYRPYFRRDIWPILMRPYNAQWVTDFLGISHEAHEIGANGDFEKVKLAAPPTSSADPYREMRAFVYAALRPIGRENAFANETAEWGDRIRDKPLMPALCGDNPLTNTHVSKFLTLTPTQLFLLGQWAEGRFINEDSEDIDAVALDQHGPGRALDRGVLGNILGGSFCPGGEIGWIARNPGIYSAPYRIKGNSAFLPEPGPANGAPGEFYPPQLTVGREKPGAGLEPGDLTKRSALPWQADFNECSTQPIDITYEGWSKLYEDGPKSTNITLWWPTHRPMQVFRAAGDSYTQNDWAVGIPQTNAGDLKMTTAWRELGFVVPNPKGGYPGFIEVERGG
jgi:L-Lysine epsilon oxidase N-terminal/L-lysine epsilon oxidase C-terminal domain